MSKNGKPATLIQLAGHYRPATFPVDSARRRDLAAAASTIHRNCTVTISFTERTLRNAKEDGEEFFALCALRDEARHLKRRCARVTKQSFSTSVRKEVETLKLEYDSFADSVRHMFILLDRGLAARLDGVL